jgi:hypothetical protein
MHAECRMLRAVVSRGVSYCPFLLLLLLLLLLVVVCAIGYVTLVIHTVHRNHRNTSQNPPILLKVRVVTWPV